MIKKILWICGLAVTLASVSFAQERDERRVAVERALVALSGTAAVLEPTVVQSALAEPQHFFGMLGRLDEGKLSQLIKGAGFQVWEKTPRIAIFLEDSLSLSFVSDSVLLEEAHSRGLRTSTEVPAAEVMDQVATFFQAASRENVAPVLVALDVDALVKVTLDQSGRAEWVWFDSIRELNGITPSGTSWQSILPHLLAEKLSAEVQWPEAKGRFVLHIKGVSTLKAFAELESILQKNAELKGVSLVKLDGDHVYFAVDNESLQSVSEALKQDVRFSSSASVNYPDEQVRLAHQYAGVKSTWVWRPLKPIAAQ